MKPGYETKLTLAALFGALPAVLAVAGLLAFGEYPPKIVWTIGLLILVAWIGAAVAVRRLGARPLETITNVLAAIREGDLTIRAHAREQDGPLYAAVVELNHFADSLREERLGALEASALLQRVMSEIDVAIFAFDGQKKLRLVNPAGEKLLGLPGVRAIGLDAAALGLADTLEGEVPRKISLPGGGPWELRRSAFRQGGYPHVLVVLADVHRVLREEEREAWKRLVRVLGHEINNSLAPIGSIAESVRELITQGPRPADWEQDAAGGLEVIARRAQALERFMTGYSKLARLPPPRLAEVEVGAWLERVAALEKRVPVELVAGPPASIDGDADQLDQLLINLIKNAADVSVETRSSVELTWTINQQAVAVSVRDRGPGLAETQNLFVPFFTTKPNGSGIGLVLSRQIAEAHGGTLALANRTDGRGCEARVVLPRRSEARTLENLSPSPGAAGRGDV